MLVDSFQIEEHVFINQRLVLTEYENQGYLEKIFDEEFSFFRLQKKVFVGPSNSRPHGEFNNLKEVFYLLSDASYQKITQKKEFLDCFPDNRSQIKKYMKNHSLKWKRMTNNQLAELLKFCHDQS